MFGDSMFEGGDVNATSLGGGANTSYAAPGSVNEAGQFMDGSVNEAGQPMSVSADPAQRAVMTAEQGADATTNQMSSAMNVSGAISHGAGLFTAIDNLVGKGRKVAKNQRKYSRMAAQWSVNQSQRALAQYQDDSVRERAQLSQSYAGRGLGESSIQTEGMKYYDDQVARKMATLNENVQLAQSGQRLVKSQISQSYVQPYIGFWNSIAGML